MGRLDGCRPGLIDLLSENRTGPHALLSSSGRYRRNSQRAQIFGLSVVFAFLTAVGIGSNDMVRRGNPGEGKEFGPADTPTNMFADAYNCVLPEVFLTDGALGRALVSRSDACASRACRPNLRSPSFVQANSFATTVASRALTLGQVVIVAGICEFAGAVLLGAGVTNTIKSGVADLNAFVDIPSVLMYGFLAVSMTTAFWDNTASYLAMPVSMTHTTVGATVGMALALEGGSAVIWSAEKDEFPYVAGAWGWGLQWGWGLYWGWM